ncbi:MFS transporter, partial [bacterium]|nr:MFS transporter [bacterium]
SDRVGRKPVLLIGSLGFAAAFVLQGLAQNLEQFIAVRILAGMLSSAMLPTAMAYVADTTSAENRSSGVGMMGAAMGLGMILGPTLGGFLTHYNPALPPAISGLLQSTLDPATGDVINLSIPFFASAILALTASPLIFFALPESLSAEKRQHASEQKTNVTRSKAMLQSLRGPMGFLFVLAFVLAFALANMESVLSLYGKQQFQMGPSQIGLLMGAMGLVAVVQQGVMIGPLTRRFGEMRIIESGLVIGILGFIGLALAPTQALLIVSALVFNVGSVLLQPSVTALISKQATSGQGELMGMNNSFQSLGRGVGPLWAGAAFDFYSTLSFWSGALIQAGILFAALRIFAKSNLQSSGGVNERSHANVG